MAPFPIRATAPGGRSIDPWYLRDPGDLLRRLDRLLPLTPGTIVALVDRPSTRQSLRGAVRIQWSEDPPQDELDADLDSSARSELLHDVVHELWGPRPTTRWPRDHAFVTVVVRPGRVVFGPPEYRVLTAWRYTNHLLPVMQGDLLLVTEHGWRAFFDDSCGARPASRRTATPLLVAADAGVRFPLGGDGDLDDEASWEA